MPETDHIPVTRYPLPVTLLLVTDRALCPLERLPGLVARLVEHGVDAVQLREKDLPEAQLLAVARQLREAAGDRARLFVNGSLEVALAAGTDGVQLSEVAEARASVRERAGGRLIIGRSVHGIESAVRAEAEGADLLVLGTIYPSRSHPGGAASGPSLVREVAARVRIPVIGIGGITEENAGAVIRAGASGVAVISALLAAPDPPVAAERLRAAVDAARAAQVESVR